MNCKQANPLLFERLDGDLDRELSTALKAHLSLCPQCQAISKELDSSHKALRSLAAPSTSPALQTAILQAVDESRASAVAGPIPIWAGRSAATHLIALATGATLAAAALLLIPRFAESLVEPRVERVLVAAEPEIQVLERRVEVLKEVRVEVPVEVPIEVQVEVPVPFRVEVPVEVQVERIVRVPVEVVRIEYRDALSTRALASLSQALNGLSQSIDTAVLSQGPASLTQTTPMPSAPPSESQTLPFAEASMRVVRAPGRITLHTEGPINKLVPLLLGKLSDRDPELADVVERRLAALRSAAEADSLLASQLIEVETPSPRRSLSSRVFGSSPPKDPRSSEEQWNDWWAANGDLVASAGDRLLR